MAQPVIGLTLDHEPPGGYSSFPWYAIRENYCNAVRKAGGLPILLPHDPDAAADYLDRIDGLIVTGGGFDVDPALFGASSRHPSVTTKDRRTAFELAAARGAIARDMPLLGICGGQQLLNVALGGTLIQHLPDDLGHTEHRRVIGSFDQADHDVRLAPGSQAARAAGEERHNTKSHHHQAVGRLGEGLEVTGWAVIDDLPEAIEDPSLPFALGVQWHPEADALSRVIGALVASARSGRAARI
jgi:putative glutamine amidotransferase